MGIYRNIKSGKEVEIDDDHFLQIVRQGCYERIPEKPVKKKSVKKADKK